MPRCRMSSALTKCRGRAFACAFFLSSVIAFLAAPKILAQGPTPGPIRVESGEVLVPILVLDGKRLQDIHHMNPAAFVREARTQDSRMFRDIAVSGLSAKDFQLFEDGKEQKVQSVTSELVSAFDGSAADAGGQDTRTGKRAGLRQTRRPCHSHRRLDRHQRNTNRLIQFRGTSDRFGRRRHALADRRFHRRTLTR
jgi:hypothetical protein